MSIEEIFMLEIDGLTKTICDYTTDNYITSYAIMLGKSTYPSDKKKINLILQRLQVWYEDSIHEIRNNKYIHNLNAHEKSYSLIKILLEHTK